MSAAALAAPLGRRAAEMEPALAALASQGEVIAGAFTAPGREEWCERRVLIRLQRASLQQRRARQDPVAPRHFQRFLFRWHGLDSPPSGEASLSAALDRLAGCSAPAGAWERDLLPARVAGFTPAALDALLAQGRYVWLRLDPPAPDEAGRPRFRGGSLRQIPLALLPRAQLIHWRCLAPPTDPAQLPLSGAARAVLDLLGAQGALFFEELALDSRLLPAHLETALAELVGWGLITADGFAGFRRRTAGARRPGRLMGGRRDMPSPLARAGRWSRLRPLALPEVVPARFPSQPLETLEQVARTLLRRYGVVFKTLLARESPLPPWRELLYVLWRLEAQGEVLGGRFIEGVSGEQFALPEAAGLLREMARQTPAGERVTLSAADPLNLTGILTPDERVPALPGRSVCYLDGLPVESRPSQAAMRNSKNRARPSGP
jgi:ATP-dependent Lhr-like helicase